MRYRFPRCSQLAPNLISADNRSRKWAESANQSVLRCHQLWEIGRVGAYFDHLSLNCKQRRTRWRREPDLNRRDPLFRACFRAFTHIPFLQRETVAGKTRFTEVVGVKVGHT
jgi:hypothetical protein